MYEWDMKSLNAYANIDLTEFDNFEEIAQRLISETQLDMDNISKVMRNIWKSETVVLGDIHVNWFVKWWSWEPFSIDDIVESVERGDDLLLLITYYKIFLDNHDMTEVRSKVKKCMQNLSSLQKN